MPPLIKPLQFLKEIHEKGVRYVLIGRQAVIAYGGPVQSMDYDIYVDSAEENLKILLSVAEEFDLLPTLSLEAMKKHFKFRLENSFIVDVFKAKNIGIGKGKVITFEEIYARRNVLKGETGLELNLPAIDDLITLKKLRSLPKDLQDIEYLKKIKKN